MSTIEYFINKDDKFIDNKFKEYLLEKLRYQINTNSLNYAKCLCGHYLFGYQELINKILLGGHYSSTFSEDEINFIETSLSIYNRNSKKELNENNKN